MTCCGYPRSSWFCPECGKRLSAQWPKPEPGSSRPWPTYWVEFREEIDASNTCFFLSRLVDLPFVPISGMTIEGLFWVDEEDAFDADLCTIDRVYYSMITGRFDCWIKPTYRWPKDGLITVEIATRWIARGCQLDGHADAQEWARKARANGDNIPETGPIQAESSP